MDRAELVDVPSLTSETVQPFLDALPVPAVIRGPLGETLRANAEGERVFAHGVPPVRSRAIVLDGRPATLVIALPGPAAGGDEPEAARTLARVFMANPLAMSILRMKTGRFINVNEKWVEFFGHPRAQVVGKTGAELGLWADPKQRDEVFGLLASRRHVRSVEARFRRKDGGLRDGLVAMEVLEGGPDPIGIAIITDLTESKRMRRTLDDVTQRFRLFVESVEEYAIFLVDAEGMVVTWNPGAERIKGYSEAEAIGSHISRFYTPEDRKRGVAKRLLSEAAKNGRSVHQGWRVRKDGTKFWAEVLMTVLRGEDGRVTGFAKITRDLTERKKAEEAESLRRREEIQREVVANVSHELRTPIAAIRGFVETLLGGALDDEDNRRKFVQIIDRHASHLAKLVEDILNLSALDAGPDAAPETIELAPFIEQATVGLHPLIKRRGLRLSVELDRKISVSADPHRLRQVLGNLLGNAVKYNKPKGKITVTSRRKDKVAVISVCDTGMGIQASELPLLFERFHRTASAQRGAVKGTGLGLSIAKRIVERWGGRIWAESDGHGSVFRFTVPLA